MSENDSVVPSCLAIWMFVLYLIGAMIVGQVAWAETGVLWDAVKFALLWPITAAVMVAAGV
jgi:hypothetical protein